ncbi:MAG: outer membrane protein assembly factor [Desulfobulbus sp.]|nr:outer membrane protein assembly factor [Desulfobulbus sp.]
MRTTRFSVSAVACAVLIGALIFLITLVFCGVAWAAKSSPVVRLEITGDLTETHRQNIRSTLSLARAADNGALSAALFNSLYRNAKKEAARALEPFGYYDPVISLSKRQEDGVWLVRLEVDTGRPVIIEEIQVEMAGPGKQDKVLLRAVERLPLHTGEKLDHPRYETAKDGLVVVAIESGYLKAGYITSRVEIRRKDYAAVVRLHLDSGPCYVFGPITFSRDFIDHALLHKILPVQQGEPLTPKNLARLRQSLFNVGYFSTVDLVYDLDDAASPEVPVLVDLQPAPANRYAVGLGYGTDTGVRGTLEYANRYVNSRGHQLDLRLQPSERKSTFSSAYTIPLGDPRRDRLSLLASYEIENYDNIESNLFKTTISRDYFRERGEYSTYLQYLDERYETGPDSGHAAAFIPGVRGVLYFADDRVATTRGLRLAGSLSGSSKGPLGDVSFLQAAAGVKGILTVFDKWRVIGRSDLGATVVDDIDDLPLSLRYFAGGDQSVRGYGYKKIGPRDREGNIVGGRYLFTWSAELERELFDQWSAAIFYDAGSVMNSFPNLNLKEGAGAGIRWNAPFGQVRLDLAKPINDGSNSLRVHFTLGADL